MQNKDSFNSIYFMYGKYFFWLQILRDLLKTREKPSKITDKRWIK